ncbi:Rab proteins geranylgeranyltransferase component A [Oleoguttula sp. CCFEE 5521]
METLDGTEWDVVIVGTDLPQSLLALSLSRSGKRVLHIDGNEYYGGNEAALSLSEAEAWAARYAGHSNASENATFSNARIETLEAMGDVKLSQSRAYSLALAPQIVYTLSKLLPALVSSRTHGQLEFQAVGSWFVLQPGGDAASAPSLIRVPSGREDIFQDQSFDLRAKRSLMKFLRFVGNYEEQPDTWQGEAERPFPEFLQQEFGLPQPLHAALLSLTLAPTPPAETSTADALPRIARHLRSIGLFGPGFGAVIPKWGGLAEIAQVACRAGAVGGAVYVLNKGIDHIDNTGNDTFRLKLSGGEQVETHWLVGSAENLLAKALTPPHAGPGLTKSISIIAARLPKLFPVTAEGGVTPAGAVIAVPASTADEPPVYIMAHSADAGECPSTQCVIYASVALPFDEGQARLSAAVAALLASGDGEMVSAPLWTIQYYQHDLGETAKALNPHCLVLPPLSLDNALADHVLEDVKQAWRQITGEEDASFLRFEVREGMED